jgi:hypothetical protein
MSTNKFYYFNKFYDSLLKQPNTLAGEIFSILDVDFKSDLLTPNKLINDDKFEKKYKPIFLKSSMEEKNMIHSEGIFLYSNFYIYLLKNKESNQYDLKIIYRANNLEEVKVYINQLKKLK